jgi:hypothetical protein
MGQRVRKFCRFVGKRLIPLVRYLIARDRRNELAMHAVLARPLSPDCWLNQGDSLIVAAAKA